MDFAGPREPRCVGARHSEVIGLFHEAFDQRRLPGAGRSRDDEEQPALA
jgi:hypothetical protein